MSRPRPKPPRWLVIAGALVMGGFLALIGGQMVRAYLTPPDVAVMAVGR